MHGDSTTGPKWFKPRCAEWCACGQQSRGGSWRCAQGITEQLRGAPGQAPLAGEQVAEALGRARLVLRIFFSLNSPGLTEVPAPLGRACPKLRGGLVY